MKLCTVPAVFLFIFAGALGSVAEAQTVKITPLGSKTGEFCGTDRALLFEDPTGVRILYDPGNTIGGGTDPRLGDIHAILISHAHGDHLGTSRLTSDPGAGAAGCAGATTTAAANSIVAEIAAEKKSAIIASANLAGFVGARIASVTQTNTAGCPAAGLTNEMTVPRPAPCTGGVGIGSKRTIRISTATQGVVISSVPSDHPSEAPATLLSDPERTNLTSNALNGYLGMANGFIVSFTNGLRVYLSGDSGLSGEMATLIRGFYSANLAVLNIGDIFTIGPEEAAFAVTDLIRPNAVIPSHANEAATMGGIVQASTRTGRFIELLTSRGAVPYDDGRAVFATRRRVPVFVPLSGLTMEFAGVARCIVGCQGQ